MHKNYISAFDKLEDSKDTLLANLSSYGPEQIATNPKGKWSAIQHCYHLYLAEEVSLRYVKKKLSFDPPLKDAGIFHHFRLWALKLIEIIPLKFKAPTAISEQAFPDPITLDIVNDKWSKSRLELKEFLEQVDDRYANKEIYKQPSVGRLTLKGMLYFFQFHHERHVSHIKKENHIA